MLLAALLATAIAIGAFDRRPTLVDVLPIVSPSPERTAIPSNDASTEPSDYTPPTPICPAPATAPTVPDVTVSIGTAPGGVATHWGAGITTCSTTGTEDAVPSKPTLILSAGPGDRFLLTLPSGWAFLRAAATDQATTSDATSRAPIEPTDRPVRVELPVTADAGESIVGFDLWIISDDGRVVAGMSVGIRVRISGPTSSSTP